MRLLLAAALLLLAPAADADRAFRAGDYARAAELYAEAIARDGESPALRYNLGTALLLAGDHDAARQQLALAVQGDAAVRQPAWYNAGNTDLEPAFANRAAANRDALLRAVAAYRSALRLDPHDLDAKWNLELAERLLAQRPDAPQAGGGGGGGGGGGQDEAPARPDADPQPGAPGAEQPDMSEAQAQQLLQRAAARDAEVQRSSLRRQQPSPPNVRDW